MLWPTLAACARACGCVCGARVATTAEAVWEWRWPVGMLLCRVRECVVWAACASQGGGERGERAAGFELAACMSRALGGSSTEEGVFRATCKAAAVRG